ncbi:MAG TPA: DnaA/Hda family protein [Gemmatimonadaceae bacterium]|nr:DnaA/Hda family protein [Gemmatimonadaceae bacterium]
MSLDERYRFENFVVGAANKLAVAAANAVAHAPGAAYNPLFIYSGSGLGKTHLLIATGQLAHQVMPELTIYYATLDEFVEQLHGAIAAGRSDAFRQHFDTIDMLLLDDVQFLAGHRETQSEMLRLFNALQRTGRQIVLTSDRAPAEISDLDERLITRFSGGLIVDIGPPDYETRVAILRRKCEERGAEFEQGVVEEVARLGFSNVRELQGALNRLVACATLGQQRVTRGNVRALLGERLDASKTLTPAVSGAVGDEFSSFLHELADAVGDTIAPWRARLGEAITEWQQLGYRVDRLERALEHTDDPGVAELLAAFERDVDRLRRLSAEAASLDGAVVDGDLLRDPDRVDEAEALVARVVTGAGPLPAPRPELSHAAFEAGPSNQLAVHASGEVVEEPGRKYNPLYVHGPAGVGKTHLLHAIGGELVNASGGAMRVACLGAHQFVDELIAALQEGAIERWRARYRDVDALLLDDVQQCAGTERAQEELFHLFNNLYADGKQIVVAGDRPPRALDGIDERLRSRFGGGLVVEIRPPDRELRARLFARALADGDAAADPELVEYLAARPATSVTELLATVSRLRQAATISDAAITPAFARAELEGTTLAAAPTLARGAVGIDAFFLDREKVVWEWPDLSGLASEELR